MTEHEKRVLEAAAQDLTRVYNRISSGIDKAVLGMLIKETFS